MSPLSYRNNLNYYECLSGAIKLWLKQLHQFWHPGGCAYFRPKWGLALRVAWAAMQKLRIPVNVDRDSGRSWTPIPGAKRRQLFHIVESGFRQPLSLFFLMDSPVSGIR
jgi:hypothetical protein